MPAVLGGLVVRVLALSSSGRRTGTCTWPGASSLRCCSGCSTTWSRTGGRRCVPASGSGCRPGCSTTCPARCSRAASWSPSRGLGAARAAAPPPGAAGAAPAGTRARRRRRRGCRAPAARGAGPVPRAAPGLPERSSAPGVAVTDLLGFVVPGPLQRFHTDGVAGHCTALHRAGRRAGRLPGDPAARARSRGAGPTPTGSAAAVEHPAGALRGRRSRSGRTCTSADGTPASSLPWRLVQNLPVIEQILPSRLSVFVLLLLVVALAWELDRCLRRHSAGPRRWPWSRPWWCWSSLLPGTDAALGPPRPPASSRRRRCGCSRPTHRCWWSPTPGPRSRRRCLAGPGRLPVPADRRLLHRASGRGGHRYFNAPRRR